MPKIGRRTYTYGGSKNKPKADKTSWDDITSKSPKKSPKKFLQGKKSIWSKVSVSPFKNQSQKVKDTCTSEGDDPFGYEAPDPYEFNDDLNIPLNKLSPKKSLMKSPKKKATPTKNKIQTPKKKTQPDLDLPLKSQKITPKKVKSPPLSPTGKSRVFGKAMPEAHTTLTVKDLQSFGSPKNRRTDYAKKGAKKDTIESNGTIKKMSTKSKGNTKTYFKKTAEEPNLDVTNTNVDLEDDSLEVMGINLETEDIFNEKVKFIDENDIPNVTQTRAKLTVKGRKVGRSKKLSKKEQKLSAENEITITDENPTSGKAKDIESEKVHSDEVLSKSMEVDENDNKDESDKTSLRLSSKGKAKKIFSSSLFSYYDKQKKKSNEKTASNIFSEPRKTSLFSEESDAEIVDTSDTNSLPSSQTSKRSLPKETLMEESDSKRLKVDDFMATQSTGSVEPSQELSESSQETDQIKKVKSPFKSLNARSTLHNRKVDRRFSALPTNISSLDSSGEDAEAREPEEDDDTDDAHNMRSPPPLYTSALFGFSRVDTAVRVKKNEKELFTVVKNTKHAHECLEHGESQQCKDDLEYLIDGLKPSHNVSTRCLSALELASKCVSPFFRMQVKASGTIEIIFTALQDALDDERLALSTSTIMFVLARDKLKINFNKKIIEFMLKLLARKTSECGKNKEFERILKKVRTVLVNFDVSHIDLEQIDATLLARETLLSFTSHRIGEWFKDEIRTLGGLDHLVDTVYACSNCIQKKQELKKNFRIMERCMLLLCDMSFRSSRNQTYVEVYRDGLLIESCVKTLNTITTELNLVKYLSTELEDCLFSSLRLLTNLSHENASGSMKICREKNALSTILRCALHLPQYLSEKKTFDCTVVSIGLLINLVEHSYDNATILNTSLAPVCYESQSMSESSQNLDDSTISTNHATPIESLMQLFLLRFEACKEGDLMEELDKLENEQEQKDAAMHYHDDEYALTCGDKFDDTVEEGTDEIKIQEDKIEENVSSSDRITLDKKEKQDIKNTLEKAHRHMEDSHVAAYSSLLIGLLLEDNKENQELIHALLPNGDFKLMRESLEKILSFMKMTGVTNESGSGLEAINRIIMTYKKYEETFANTNTSVEAT